MLTMLDLDLFEVIFCFFSIRVNHDFRGDSCTLLFEDLNQIDVGKPDGSVS